MSEELLRALLTVGFGAVAGGLTNTVAIWMLFHPYEPPRIGRWRLTLVHGAVPKNQARLAAAIGRTVGGKLLTEDDLARTFSDTQFRRAFDERLGSFLDEALHRERPSIREMIPPAVLPEIESLVAGIVEHALEQMREYLDSARFEEAVHRRADELVQAVGDEPIAGVLTPVREAALTAAIEDWLTDAANSEDFRNALDDYLRRGTERLLQPNRTFEEILPLGLVSSVESAIASYLPLAIERLGKLLEDPKARARLESTLHDLFHRFLSDLKFHQRVVARLVVQRGDTRQGSRHDREGGRREALGDPPRSRGAGCDGQGRKRRHRRLPEAPGSLRARGPRIGDDQRRTGCSRRVGAWPSEATRPPKPSW